MNNVVEIEMIVMLLIPVLMEALKHYINMPTKVIPLMNIVIAVGLGLGFNNWDLSVIPMGILWGLSASGLYSSAKSMTKIIGNEE